MTKLLFCCFLLVILPAIVVSQNVTRCQFVSEPCQATNPYPDTCHKYVCAEQDDCTSSTADNCQLANNDDYQLYVIDENGQRVLKYDNYGNTGFIKEMYKKLPDGMKRVDTFAIDFDQERIFVYQALVGKIYVKQAGQDKWTMILNRAGLNITSLTYDFYSDSLYFCDLQRGEIHVASADGSGRRRRLVSNFQIPSKLYLYPEVDLMLVSGTKNVSTGTGVWKFDLAGNNEQRFDFNPYTGYPVDNYAANIEKGILYMLSIKRGIISKEYGRWTSAAMVGQYTITNITSIAADDTFLFNYNNNGYLYLTNQDQMQSITEPQNVIELPIGFGNKSQIISKKPCIQNYCAKQNCSYLCLFGGFADWIGSNQAIATPTTRCFINDD